jgi:hypothetical protein
VLTQCRQIHTILYQFLEFLTTIDLRLLSEKAGTELKPMIPLEEYASKVVPPLADLHGLYDIDAAICMTLYRPILNNIVLVSIVPCLARARCSLVD